MSSGLSLSRSFSIQSPNLVESLSVWIDHLIDLVAIGLADVANCRLILVRLADDQIGQHVVLGVFHRHARADADRAGTDRLGIGIQHAVQLVLARLVCWRRREFQVHQRRGGLGQMFAWRRPDSSDARESTRPRPTCAT